MSKRPDRNQRDKKSEDQEEQGMETLKTRESGKVTKREEQHTEDDKIKSKVGRYRPKQSNQFSRDKLKFPFRYYSLAPWISL